MKNWKKDRNYRKFENTDGSISYVITVDGEDVSVNQEVYEAYAETERKMEYAEHDLKCSRVHRDNTGKAVRDKNGLAILLPEREVSLDKLMREHWDFESAEPTPEDIVLQGMQTEELNRCLGLLGADERALIDALFFEGLTEREYAKQIRVVQKTVNYRKYKVFGKLKKLFENN